MGTPWCTHAVKIDSLVSALPESTIPSRSPFVHYCWPVGPSQLWIMLSISYPRFISSQSLPFYSIALSKASSPNKTFFFVFSMSHSEQCFTSPPDAWIANLSNPVLFKHFFFIRITRYYNSFLKAGQMDRLPLALFPRSTAKTGPLWNYNTGSC